MVATILVLWFGNIRSLLKQYGLRISNIYVSTEPSTNDLPSAKAVRLATVVRAMSDNASRVRNAWCE